MKIFSYQYSLSQEPQTSGSHTLSHTHTFSPPQPTAHLASMEYPLNISLFAVCPHSTAQEFTLFISYFSLLFFPFVWLVYLHTNLSTSQQQWLSCVSVGMLFSFFHFQDLVQNTSVITHTHTHTNNHLCDPDSFCFSGLHHTFQKVS